MRRLPSKATSGKESSICATDRISSDAILEVVAITQSGVVTTQPGGTVTWETPLGMVINLLSAPQWNSASVVLGRKINNSPSVAHEYKGTFWATDAV